MFRDQQLRRDLNRWHNSCCSTQWPPLLLYIIGYTKFSFSAPKNENCILLPHQYSESPLQLTLMYSELLVKNWQRYIAKMADPEAWSEVRKKCTVNPPGVRSVSFSITNWPNRFHVQRWDAYLSLEFWMKTVCSELHSLVFSGTAFTAASVLFTNTVIHSYREFYYTVNFWLGTESFTVLVRWLWQYLQLYMVANWKLLYVTHPEDS